MKVVLLTLAFAASIAPAFAGFAVATPDLDSGSISTIATIAMATYCGFQILKYRNRK